MNSMTGYGQATTTDNQVEVTIRTYNSRHLELKLNLPEELEFLREDIEKNLKSNFNRGTVHLKIQYSNIDKLESDESSTQLKNLAREYKKLKAVFKKETKENLLFSDFLKLEAKTLGAQFKNKKLAEDKKLIHAIKQALQSAISETTKTRASEGIGLKKVLDRILTEMSSIRDTLTKSAANIEQENKKRIQNLAKDSGLFDGGDNPRVQQEILFLLDKQSVAEELSRLELHFKAIKDLFNHKDPIGKKLEFYGQEILREVNTVGSKIQSGNATEQVVNFKSCIENFREQVQNVE